MRSPRAPRAASRVGRRDASLVASLLAPLVVAAGCATDVARLTLDRLVKRQQDEALADLDPRIADDPTDPQLRVLRAEVLICSYEWDAPDVAKLHRAIDDASAVLDAKPDGWREHATKAHQARLDAYRLLGDVRGELKELESTWKDGLTSSGLYDRLFYGGFAFLCNDRYAESIAWFTEYKKQHPFADHTNHTASALRLRAEAHLRSGNEAASLADLAESIKHRDWRRGSRDILLLGERVARRLGELGQWDEAAWILAECVAVDPGAGSRLRRAMALLRLGKVQLAKDDLRCAFEVEPVAPLAFVVRGLVDFAEGNNASGFRSLAIAIERDPNLAEAYYERGRQILADGGAARVEAAIADFQRYAQLRPADLSVLELVALAHMTKGRWQVAIDTLAPLVHADPRSPEVNRLLAQAHYKLEHWQEAADALEVVLRATPHDADARVARAEALFPLERYLDAAGLCESVPKAKARALRLACFAAAGERSQALLALAALAHCTDVEILASLATALERLAGRPNGALAAELRPRVEGLHACAAGAAKVAALCERQQWRDAVALLDEQLATTPAYGPFWLLRGGAKLALGDADQALADAERGARIWDDTSFLRLRGQALEKLGRNEEALVAWEGALAADATARQPLAELLVRLGRSADALPHFRELVSKGPVPSEDRRLVKTYIRLATTSRSANDCCNAYQAWLHWNPSDHEARFQYAYWLAAVEDWAGAVHHYGQCEALTRGDTAAKYAAIWYFNRSFCLWKLERFFDAQRDQDEALRLDPKLPRIDMRDWKRLAAEQAQRERLEQQWRERDAVEAREFEAYTRFLSSLSANARFGESASDKDWWDNQSAGAELDRRIRMIKAGINPPSR